VSENEEEDYDNAHKKKHDLKRAVATIGTPAQQTFYKIHRCAHRLEDKR